MVFPEHFGHALQPSTAQLQASPPRHALQQAPAHFSVWEAHGHAAFGAGILSAAKASVPNVNDRDTTESRIRFMAASYAPRAPRALTRIKRA